MQNLFKQRLNESRTRPLVGTWLMSASPTCAEAVGWVGLDFAVVDMEHVPLDVHDVIDQLRALAPTPTAAVTRVPWNDAVMVKRVLDVGAQTLMFPMVQSPQEAQQAVSAMRYPPRGVRGVAVVHRASRYGAQPDYLRTCEQALCAIVQVETPQAFDRIGEIAAVDGVDAVFIGPSDLAANAGHLGNFQHPEVMRMLESAPALIHAQGKKAGTLMPNADLARHFAGAGYDFVAIGSDVSALTAAMRGHLTAWGRDVAPPSPGSAY